MRNILFRYKNQIVGVLLLFCYDMSAQTESVARKWNELNLLSIENDYTRPTVQARNLHHITAAMYDAWAVYDSISKPYFLGNTVNGYTTPYKTFEKPNDIFKARQAAISYAAYRLLSYRYKRAPKRDTIFPAYWRLMNELNLDTSYMSIDYQSGDPRAMGNYIAHHVIEYGLQDGSNEANDFINTYYMPFNPPMRLDTSGTSGIIDLNRWQPLRFKLFIDQGGNINPDNVPSFLGAEWGNVSPFAMPDSLKRVYTRDDSLTFQVFNDPGDPPYIESEDSLGFGAFENFYKWGNLLVSEWSSQLDENNATSWDISPNNLGNVQEYPNSAHEYPDFYKLSGGDNGLGYEINPKTGEKYLPQFVKRADYARVLAEFWADGPNSETPPGHWFTILNYINDSPLLVKKLMGQGPILDPLEWDVKAYFALGGAMHDAAISAWSIKGYYDYVRPISAIRGMAELGQSTDPSLPRYHIHGLPLISDHTELVTKNDPLAGFNLENLWEIKIKVWRGYSYITEDNGYKAGVGWILAKDFSPYQRATFVTPPFGGYISGHSTFSRAGAEVLSLITGDDYFPGGMGEFKYTKDISLIHEHGPSTDVVLQWAKYTDAADQCSLSRIWGGIHPPCDDIPGRMIGSKVGKEAFSFCIPYFYQNADLDNYYSYEDCDDSNPSIHPNAVEICDGLDNNCNQTIDEGLPIYTYYLDKDLDGYGDLSASVDTCAQIIVGYVFNNMDCNDNDNTIFPGANEIANNGIDEDCEGGDLISNTIEIDNTTIRIFPNPASEFITVENEGDAPIELKCFNLYGVPVLTPSIILAKMSIKISTNNLTSGIYLFGTKGLVQNFKYQKIWIIK